MNDIARRLREVEYSYDAELLYDAEDEIDRLCRVIHFLSKDKPHNPPKTSVKKSRINTP